MNDEIANMASPVRSRPLRVMHFICPTGFYGAERWVLSLVDNIDRDAVVSELAVIRERGESSLKLTEKFRALGLDAHEITAAGRFDIKIVSRLVDLLRRRQIDVLHTHGYKPDILGVVAAKRAGVRNVCTTHGFENSKDLKLRFYMWLGCQSFRFFDKVVPLTEHLGNTARGYGVGPDRLQVIQSGIDLKPIEPFIKKREPGHYHDTGSLTVGFIGQMISRKNIDGLMDVFDELRHAVPDIRLELVGDGAQRHELERYAAKLASSDQIEFVGFVDNPLDYLQKFDLFVMTSTLEGTPLCLMEAMAMGVPAAAFAIPGVDLLIEQGRTGFSAQPGDNSGLVTHCATLLSDPDLARRLASEARKRVLEEFSAQRMAREYLTVYKSLASTPV